MALLVVFFAAWGSALAWGDSLPWPLLVVVMVYLGGLWMSLGHELLHGHPTRWTWLNTAVGFVPLSLWLPYTRYKTTHIQHHRSDLTDPIDDPESLYVLPQQWQHAGVWKRRVMLAVRTAPGRFTLGVPVAVARFVYTDLRRGDARIRIEYLVHTVAAVALGWWLFGVVGFSPMVYVFGFCLGGSACTQLRSFVEHCAVAEGTRSAVVKAGPVLSLLFLNINLHHTHHAEPDVVWYRIPALHRAMGSDQIAAAGAGLYEGGYLEVLRRHFFHPFCQPDHPLSPGARPYGARGVT
ncbi:MAG: fatty acid desaturase [Actinomycetota bacterium]|nr:fatty acid desaturase [Actinomycetota bacterium]